MSAHTPGSAHSAAVQWQQDVGRRSAQRGVELGLGALAGAAGAAAGAAGAADGRVRHQLRVPRCAHAAQVLLLPDL